MLDDREKKLSKPSKLATFSFKELGLVGHI